MSEFGIHLTDFYVTLSRPIWRVILTSILFNFSTWARGTSFYKFWLCSQFDITKFNHWGQRLADHYFLLASTGHSARDWTNKWWFLTIFSLASIVLPQTQIARYVKKWPPLYAIPLLTSPYWLAPQFLCSPHFCSHRDRIVVHSDDILQLATTLNFFFSHEDFAKKQLWHKNVARGEF